MRKFLILILLFVVACSKDNSKVAEDITSDKVPSHTIIKSYDKKSTKEPIYNKEKDKKTLINPNEINDIKEVDNADKKLSTTVVDNTNKEVLANTKSLIIKQEVKVSTQTQKEKPKVESKPETTPPVAHPKEDPAPLPEPMPENRPEETPKPYKLEVYIEKIYIGEIGNSGMEFNNWDEAGSWAEAQVFDKTSKYYHYSWARTTIIYYTYDSKGVAQPNSKRETYTIDFWE